MTFANEHASAMQSIDLTKYAFHHWQEHDFRHSASCEQAPGCQAKLSKPSRAVQSRAELSRPVPSLSKPSRAFQIRSRAASRAPSNAAQSSGKSHAESLQSFPDTPSPRIYIAIWEPRILAFENEQL